MHQWRGCTISPHDYRIEYRINISTMAARTAIALTLVGVAISPGTALASSAPASTINHSEVA